MSNLASMLEWLYPDAPLGSYRVQQDSEHDGPYIAAWDVPGVSQPTIEYLTSRLAEFEALPSDWREKRRAKASLAGSVVDRVALDASLRVLYESIVETRRAVNELIAGRVPATLANRTWEQALAAVSAKIEA